MLLQNRSDLIMASTPIENRNYSHRVQYGDGSAAHTNTLTHARTTTIKEAVVAAAARPVLLIVK